MSAIKQIKIGERSYPVRYDINALCEFEEITGKSLINGSLDMDLRCLRALMYVGMKCGQSYANPLEKFPLSLPQVGAMVELKGDMMKLFMEVLQESLGVKNEGQDLEDKKTGE
jgi:hypothetical protein